MNTKAENVATGASLGDILKYVVAVAIAAGGIAVFYLFPQWIGAVRGLLVILAFAAALLVTATTAVGRRGRDFLSESLFELRKVVWPTRDEAMRTTAVVLVVVIIISLVLAGFDFVIAWLMKLLLGN